MTKQCGKNGKAWLRSRSGKSKGRNKRKRLRPAKTRDDKKHKMRINRSKPSAQDRYRGFNLVDAIGQGLGKCKC